MLGEQLVQSVLDQAHLVPLPAGVAPTLAEHDHALRLYPLPSALVLADRCEPYRMTYEGCHVLNPGRFVGHAFQFAAYTPARGESEPWCVFCSSVLILRAHVWMQCCRGRHGRRVGVLYLCSILLLYPARNKER